MTTQAAPERDAAAPDGRAGGRAAAREAAHKAGGRWTRAVYSPLRPHLVRLAAAAKLELVVVQRLVVSWSYNDFGSERQYVSLGWKVPFDRSARVRRQTLRPYFSSRE